MQEHFQRRYLCNNWTELSQRVSRAISDGDAALQTTFFDEIYNKRFLPAGNTLLAGTGDITPNCAVLGYVTDDSFDEVLKLSKKLWRAHVGIGYNLSGLDDPVAGLKRLSRANDAIDLVHRPKRGNMAVLNAGHPRIREFVSCKAVDGELYNFNISVAVERDKSLDADLLDYIASLAWRTGDPGLIFLDRAGDYGPTRATDLPPVCTCVPCGEQFMHANETCNLGSVNLNADTLMDATGRGIDYAKLGETVRIAVHFLDRVIDKLVFPSRQLKRIAKRTRRIGLGVTGFADLLARDKIPYDSQAALSLAKSLSTFITSVAEATSEELAAQHGRCAYSEVHRNISLTCIAPTGGITGLTENRGYAIEPFFDEAIQLGFKAHIDMQMAWQSGIHNAVSKTVNLPSTATVAEVKALYMYAARSGCKGITLYRDGCKRNQPRTVVRCIGCTA